MRIFNALTLAFLALFASQTLSAQVYKCGTNEVFRELAAENPAILQKQHELDMITKFSGSSRDYDSTTVYTVPIVFHIIHNYGPENISDEQIYDQMRILNEDFRMLNEDTSNIVPAFKDIAADSRIEFRLAQVGPNGECTNGIDRIASLKTYDGNDDAKLNPWPRSYYLNVWVVSRMSRDGVAGYAYYPSATQGLNAPRDGIIILHDYIGSIGTGRPSWSRALTHEIGHYLNLPHTWGNTNQPRVACGDDGITDTPETEGHTSCPLNSQRCNAGVVENVQNYMEYSYCSNMFTRGQVLVMRNALNAAEGQRNLLWKPSTLDFTGVNNPQQCGPKADFYAEQTAACLDLEVQFRDVSWRDSIVSVEWQFDGGVPSFSTDRDPLVFFNTPGWHKVKMKAIGANGTDTISRERAIFILNNNSDFFGGLSEDFDDANYFAQNWVPLNPARNASEWKVIDTLGYFDNSCVMLENYGDENAFDTDELISPSVDLSQTAGTERFLHFRYASAVTSRNSEEFTDQLRISYSTNCGQTWRPIDTIIGAELATAGYVWQPFKPKSSEEWRTYGIELPQGAYASNTRFKFTLRAGAAGNNVYIDKINIGTSIPSGVEEAAALDANTISLFPNPTANNVTLNYTLAQSGDLNINVTDMTGRNVISVKRPSQLKGEASVNLQTANLSAGIYFVSLEINGEYLTKKLVVSAK